MDKKEIMSSMPSSNRGRKRLANILRGETFSDAYPNESTTDTQPDTSPLTETEQSIPIDDSENSKETSLQTENRETADELKITSTQKKQSTANRKKKKTSETVDSPREFTSFNCLKTTHTRTTVVSALLKKPIYELLDEAVDDYITRLKKSGKISVDI